VPQAVDHRGGGPHLESVDRGQLVDGGRGASMAARAEIFSSVSPADYRQADAPPVWDLAGHRTLVRAALS
jgi:hypothetical protein